MRIILLLAALFCATVSSFHFQRRLQLILSSFSRCSTVVNDKAEVEEYFNKVGFERWNNIYSESNDVNKVQLDIRTGHQQTIDKVINWLKIENNSQKTLCDAGCGVGSLALPLSSAYKQVFASDISSSMTYEAATRAKSLKITNAKFEVSDLEKLKGSYDTVTCIDVMIHYPTEKMYEIVGKLGSLSKNRLILSFAPMTWYYDILKRIGELFPDKSKTTRAYLHPEADVISALKKAGFIIRRKEMTATKFYFSRLVEAIRE